MFMTAVALALQLLCAQAARADGEEELLSGSGVVLLAVGYVMDGGSKYWTFQDERSRRFWVVPHDQAPLQQEQ